MKKFLAILGTLSLVISSSATVIACFETKTEASKDPDKDKDPGDKNDGDNTGDETPEDPDDKEPENPVVKVSLASVVDHTHLGDFRTLPTTEELMKRVIDANPNINWDEVSILEGADENATVSLNSRELKIVVDKDSEVYEEGEINLTYTIGNNEQINQLALARAKSLVIAENYGLDHKLTHNVIQKNQTDYNNLFNDKSINQIENPDINLKGTTGRKGSILDLFANGNETVLEGINNLPESIKGILGANDLEEDTTGGELIANGIETIFPLISGLIGGISNIGSLLGMVTGLLGDTKLNIATDVINDIQNKFNDFKENSFSEQYVKPILHALVVGSDLTRFADLAVDQMYAGLVFAFVNALGYGLEDDYEEIDIVSQSKILNGKFNSSANYIHENLIKNKRISNFDFKRDPAKIIENILTFVSILNAILTIYRTPEVDFNKPLEEGKNRSQYIFSDELKNDDFVLSKAKTLVKDTNLNLKAFNIAELLVNVRYYLSGSSYSLQKLLYILLFSGRLNSVSPSPLIDLIFAILDKEMSGIAIAKSVISTNVFKKLVNNEQLALDKIFNGFFWNIIKSKITDLFPEGEKESGPEKIRTAALAIQEKMGSQPFTLLYSGNLRTIFEIPELKELLPESVIDTINDLFGENNAVNIRNLLGKVKLGKILSVAGLGGNETNPNVPNFFNRFTNKSIKELINEITNYLSITGKEKSSEIDTYVIDFSLVEKIVIELFYRANGKETGLINQVIDSINDLDNVWKLLGFVNTSEDNTIFKADSFLGRILNLVMPKVTEIIEDDNISVNKIVEANLKDTLIWLLKGLFEFIPTLFTANKIDSFVDELVNNNANAWDYWYEDTMVEPFSSELKASTITIELNPNWITFKDGTKLTGKKIKYEFVVERSTNADNKFDFTKITKTLV